VGPGQIGWSPRRPLQTLRETKTRSGPPEPLSFRPKRGNSDRQRIKTPEWRPSYFSHLASSCSGIRALRHRHEMKWYRCSFTAHTHTGFLLRWTADAGTDTAAGPSVLLHPSEEQAVSITSRGESKWNRVGQNSTNPHDWLSWRPKLECTPQLCFPCPCVRMNVSHLDSILDSWASHSYDPLLPSSRAFLKIWLWLPLLAAASWEKKGLEGRLIG
jgi:hypothetical protein